MRNDGSGKKRRRTPGAIEVQGEDFGENRKKREGRKKGVRE